MKFHQFKIRFVENKKIFFGISIAVLERSIPTSWRLW